MITQAELISLLNDIAPRLSEDDVRATKTGTKAVADGFRALTRAYLSMGRNYIDRQDSKDSKRAAAVASISALAFTIGELAREYQSESDGLYDIGLFQTISSMIEEEPE